MQNLAYRGLRFASPASNGFIGELLSDSYFEVDPDALVDSAVSKESAPERISDNLTLLNEAPGPLRGEMLRYVDNISIRLSENSPEKLTERGILAWAELIRGSDTVNPNRLNRQINIPVSLVTFAVRDTNASPTISIDKTGYIVANHTGHSLVESNYQGIQHLTCVVVSAPNTYYGGRLHWSRPTQGRRDNRLGRVHSIEALRR